MGTQRRIRHKIFEWLRRYAPNEIAGWAGQRGAAAATYELTGSYAAAVIAATIGVTSGVRGADDSQHRYRVGVQDGQDALI